MNNRTIITIYCNESYVNVVSFFLEISTLYFQTMVLTLGNSNSRKRNLGQDGTTRIIFVYIFSLLLVLVMIDFMFQFGDDSVSRYFVRHHSRFSFWGQGLTVCWLGTLALAFQVLELQECTTMCGSLNGSLRITFQITMQI